MHMAKEFSVPQDLTTDEFYKLTVLYLYVSFFFFTDFNVPH
jgi:hypothetical protein